MGCVFQIHSELGRFFDEKIYKRELAHRYPGVQLEVPIEVTYASFKKLQFAVKEARWNDRTPGASRFREMLTALLRDWGTGLDLQFYEEALIHFLGGEACVVANVEVRTAEHPLGHQKMLLAAPRVAFAVTALHEADPDFESHVRRLLRHTDLEAILWANISLKMVTFTTIS